MVLAAKTEVSSNFQAIMADCSDLDSGLGLGLGLWLGLG